MKWFEVTPTLVDYQTEDGVSVGHVLRMGGIWRCHAIGRGFLDGPVMTTEAEARLAVEKAVDDEFGITELRQRIAELEAINKKQREVNETLDSIALRKGNRTMELINALRIVQANGYNVMRLDQREIIDAALEPKR